MSDIEPPFISGRDTAPDEPGRASGPSGSTAAGVETLTLDRAARIIRDRDEWADHLAHELSVHVLAVPAVLRGWYLRRVDRVRERTVPDA